MLYQQRLDETTFCDLNLVGFSSLAKLGWNLDRKWKHGTSTNPIAALLILWPRVIVVVFPSLRALLCSFNLLLFTLLETARRYVFACLCLFITECRYVSGCVHYCMNECPPVINKGLHLPPSALCILLFLVTVWWAKGLELQRLCSLFLHFSTSLNRFTFQTAGHQWVIIHLFRWKWSFGVWRGGCCCRFIRTLPSRELQIYYWKCIYYYRHHATEALLIGQPISSLKIMKLFGKDVGSQNAGQGTPSGPWQGSRGSPVKIRTEWFSTSSSMSNSLYGSGAPGPQVSIVMKSDSNKVLLLPL